MTLFEEEGAGMSGSTRATCWAGHWCDGTGGGLCFGTTGRAGSSPAILLLLLLLLLLEIDILDKPDKDDANTESEFSILSSVALLLPLELLLWLPVICCATVLASGGRGGRGLEGGG